MLSYNAASRLASRLYDDSSAGLPGIGDWFNTCGSILGADGIISEARGVGAF